MICSAEYIEQPYSGEYVEKIYDINSPWNSSNWTWIKFVDKNGEWCGEFRGEYRGVSISGKLGIVVVLTSDYMYILDIKTTDMIEVLSQPEYTDITTSPADDILITDGYGIKIFTNSKVADLKSIDMPVSPDDLKFVEWKDNILKISCYEFYEGENKIELYWDCCKMQWMGNSKGVNNKGSSICNKIYLILSAICAILLFYNIFRTDSWTGDMPFSEFTEKEWRLFWIFMIEEVILGGLMFLFALLGGKNMKKNENQEKFLNGLLIRGIVDVRKLAGVANAKKTSKW